MSKTILNIDQYTQILLKENGASCPYSVNCCCLASEAYFPFPFPLRHLSSNENSRPNACFTSCPKTIVMSKPHTKHMLNITDDCGF